MNAPNYDWVCQKCAHTNKSGIGQCEKCGFDAYFTVKQLKSGEWKNGFELTLQGVLAVVFVGICCMLYFRYSSALPGWMQMWFDPRLFMFGAFLILILMFVMFVAIYKFIVTAAQKLKSKSGT
jgi:hypothetical protein